MLGNKMIQKVIANRFSMTSKLLLKEIKVEENGKTSDPEVRSKRLRRTQTWLLKRCPHGFQLLVRPNFATMGKSSGVSHLKAEGFDVGFARTGKLFDQLLSERRSLKIKKQDSPRVDRPDCGCLPDLAGRHWLSRRKIIIVKPVDSTLEQTLVMPRARRVDNSLEDKRFLLSAI